MYSKIITHFIKLDIVKQSNINIYKHKTINRWFFQSSSPQAIKPVESFPSLPWSAPVQGPERKKVVEYKLTGLGVTC